MSSRMARAIFVGLALILAVAPSRAQQAEPRTCTQLFADDAHGPGGAVERDSKTASINSAASALRPYLAAMRYRWPSPANLRARFLDGDPDVCKRVAATAREWESHGDVHFNFVATGPADIRITFKTGLAQAYVGRDAQRIPEPQPTMELAWLTAATPDSEYARIVLHEFGHALGCVHEHQSPGASIQWNKPVVYAYYWKHHRWLPEKVDHNILDKYSDADVSATPLDVRSIMLYPIPPQFTLDGFTSGWNTALSPTDKAFIAALYPRGDGQ